MFESNKKGRHGALMSGILVAGLVGCGGGGGGGSGSGPGGIVSTSYAPLALSSGNAEIASAESAESGSDTIGVGSVGGATLTGVVLSTDDRPGLNQIGRWAIDKVRSERGSLTPSTSAVVYNQSVNCSGGGSIAVTWDDADNNSDISTGDSFTLTFSNCVEVGIRYSSGSMSMANLTLSGDPMVSNSAWSVGATLGFNDLSFSIGPDSVRVNGDMSLATQTTDGVNVNTTVSGSNLSARENGETNTLRSFNFAYTENQSTLAFSLTYSGTLDIGRVSGRVSFATTTPFTGNDVLVNWPTAGVLVITGANGSTVTLTALGGDSIRLDLDTNGDATVDQSINTTWTALTAI